MREGVRGLINVLSFKRRKLQIIALLCVYTLWILTTWPHTLFYEQLSMDSYGTFQYVHPFFWIVFAFCIFFFLFSNTHIYVKMLYCTLIGLMTFGTLSLIQQLGTHHDSLYNLTAAFEYFIDGFITVGSNSRNVYPLTYILWGTLTTVCNISLECFLKYHAMLIMMLYVVSGALLGKFFFKKRQMSEYFIYLIFFLLLFGSRFAIRLNPAPQTLGIIASIFFLALTFRSGIKFRIIQLVIFIYICLSHAISTYIVICLLFGILLSQYLMEFSIKREKIVEFKSCLATLVITTTLFITWFLYVAVFISNAGFRVLKQIINHFFEISSAFDDTSALPYLYQTGVLPIEYFISNRFGWFILLFFITIGIATIALTTQRKEYEIGIPIICMVGIMILIFSLFLNKTTYGLLLDRSFLFMIIPMGLAFAYFFGAIKDYTNSKIKRLRRLATVIILIIGIIGIFNIYLSHYTNNFNVITPTEIKADEFGRFHPTGDYRLYYIEGRQSITNPIITSRQIHNIRAYLECNIDSSLNRLENRVLNSPTHAFIYNNGNSKYYHNFPQ